MIRLELQTSSQNLVGDLNRVAVFSVTKPVVGLHVDTLTEKLNGPVHHQKMCSTGVSRPEAPTVGPVI